MNGDTWLLAYAVSISRLRECWQDLAQVCCDNNKTLARLSTTILYKIGVLGADRVALVDDLTNKSVIVEATVVCKDAEYLLEGHNAQFAAFKNRSNGVSSRDVYLIIPACNRVGWRVRLVRKEDIKNIHLLLAARSLIAEAVDIL